MALVSSLVDRLTAYPDALVWEVDWGTPFGTTPPAMEGGRFRLDGGDGWLHSLRSVQTYDIFDSVTVHLETAAASTYPVAGGCDLQVEWDGGWVGMEINIGHNAGVWELQAEYFGYTGWEGDTPPTSGGTAGDGSSYGIKKVPYDSTSMAYLRMTNAVVSGRLHADYATSADGDTWTSFYSFTADPLDNTQADEPYRVYMGSSRLITYLSDVSYSPDPDPEPEPDPTTQTPRAPRTLDPDATVPARSKTCTNLLDLIREFSTAVRGAVRIVSGSTIQMVDPNEPLPTGWDAGSGDEYYSRVTQGVNANTKVLRLSKGYMDLAMTADIIVNDAGLLTGGFRIPARLPVPDLDPAPVSRVSYTLTPKEFRASVELFYPDTPLIVRER